MVRVGVGRYGERRVFLVMGVFAEDAMEGKDD